MEPKVVPMDIKAAKITLTPTRFEVKMPTSFDAELAARVMAFAKDVAGKIGIPTQSLRGTISSGADHLSVRLKRDNKDFVASFTEEASRDPHPPLT